MAFPCGSVPAAFTAAVAALCMAAAGAAEPLRGYHASRPVAGPTRLDAVFPLANQSPAEPPAEWYAGYDSASQSYEVFVPPRLDPRKKHPLVLLIPAGAAPAGWQQFKPLCEKRGIVFASPKGAGNDTPLPTRVRIVLDVLDDLRRQLPIDPDRTYLAGFSGGGRVACGIAFALPELFGGVLPICASGKIREESWLRRRLQDRLSVALVTGETDFNRGEIELLRGPMLRDVGVRTRWFVAAGTGHAIPGAKTLGETLEWLEEGAADRRRLATEFPATRQPAEPPDRTAAAAGLLAEAKERLGRRATLHSGLMQLKGAMTRWPDTAAGAAARELLLAYDARADRPWEADDIEEQRTFLVAEARGLAAYAASDLPPQYAKERPSMAEAALDRWRLIAAEMPDTEAGREAAGRIAALEALRGEPPEERPAKQPEKDRRKRPAPAGSY